MKWRCGHCGNMTILEERCAYQTQEPEFNIKGDVVWKPITRYLFECKTCSKPTLIEINSDEILVKELRNLGAHDAEDEVTEQDVPIILDFLEAILEYLYVAPAKIEAVRTRLTRLPAPENAGRET